MPMIHSTLPGTFYIRPNPDADPYKSTGDAVAAGDTIGLVEVMKTFIEIKSEIAGTFTRYVAGNADPVTAGQELAELDG